MDFKISIVTPKVKGPWGGGAQFIKALAVQLKLKKRLSFSENDADVFMFNASPGALDSCLWKIFCLRIRYPQKPLIMRIDGPIYCTRGVDAEYDDAFHLIARNWCSGVVFQSEWSRDQHKQFGMKKLALETVIVNAPDPEKFYSYKKSLCNSPVKLIATSWSANARKGFQVYKWIDENLDFSKYQMEFVGNSPILFENIKQCKPVAGVELGEILRQADIYITASQQDPCSNALVEARHCGLPVLALNDGGHPELVGEGGLLFKAENDIPKLLEELVQNYATFQSRMDLPSLEVVADKYYAFCAHVVAEMKRKRKVSFVLQFILDVWVLVSSLCLIGMARGKRKLRTIWERITSSASDGIDLSDSREITLPEDDVMFKKRLAAYYEDYYRKTLGLPDWATRIENRQLESDTFGEPVVRRFEDISKYDLTGRRVLVVGAGTGAEMEALLRRTSEVYGIEPGESGVGLCRYRLSRAGVAPSQVVLGIAEKLPWDSNFFDVVFCNTVLEHVQDVDASLKEMIRVCRKGGRVFLALPDYRYPYEDHYKINMPTCFPKKLLKMYLKLRKRPPAFLDTLNFLTTPQVDRMLHDCNVDFARYTEPLSKGKVHKVLWWYARLRNVTKMQRIILFP